MANNDIRFGISALPLEHFAKAENDELMVRPSDGKMFYKRPDGQIVMAVPDMSFLDFAAAVEADGSVTNVANRIDISGMTDVMQKTNVNLNLGSVFHVKSAETGIVIRVCGNEITNLAVNTLVSYFKKLGVANSEPEVEITCEVTCDGKTETKVIPCLFSSWTFFNMDSEKPMDVRIVSIAFPKIFTMNTYLPDEMREALKKMNFNNGKFEAAVIDIAYEIESADKAVIYGDNGRTQLKYIVG